MVRWRLGTELHMPRLRRGALCGPEAARTCGVLVQADTTSLSCSIFYTVTICVCVCVSFFARQVSSARLCAQFHAAVFMAE